MAVVLGTTLILGACAAPTTNTPSVTTPQQANRAAEVQYGIITSARTVPQQRVNEGTDTLLGGAGGALAGVLLGNQIGGGSGRTIATGAGAVGGALLGARIAEGANRGQAQEWTVRLDTGNSLSVIQNDPSLYIGQPVRITFRDGRAEISPR